MPEVTKALELQLIDPNAHKERKLRETTETYRDALHAAFEANCTTKREANDIVVEYDLSGYAKNCLKKYVPQLCGGSDEAQDLHDEHPVRFSTRGVKLDHNPQNHYEWYVRVPHHEDYSLWLPAGINPDQRPLLEAAFAGDAEMGQSLLLERDGNWYLQISVTQTVAPRSASATERTPVGVDIGAAALATVCHRDERGTPATPNIFSDEGSEVRNLRKTYFTATRRLHQRGSDRIAADYAKQLWRRIDDILHRVSRQVVKYAQRVENPLLVLEDLTQIRDSIDYGTFMNRRLHSWAFAKLHAQIQYKAKEQGIPVETVDPRNTSKKCHACETVGTRPDQGTFRCTASDCWVSTYQADLNAALRIADKYDRCGESQDRIQPTQKVSANDSAADGASLAEPQDNSADSETSIPSSTAGSREMTPEHDAS